MADRARLHALDIGAEIYRSERMLPHWFQPGAATFVTFRTADSMPRAAIDRWVEKQRLFLRTHNLDCQPTPREIAKLPPAIQRQFKRLCTSSFNKLLDNGYGRCELRRPEIASIVAEKLWFFDGERYDLDCFVIMPNHVHLVAAIREGWDLREECDNWLHYSAIRINQVLDQSGSFWQPEPFDHCLRSVEQLEWTRRYIRRNPLAARLRRGDYFYWQQTDQPSSGTAR